MSARRVYLQTVATGACAGEVEEEAGRRVGVYVDEFQSTPGRPWVDHHDIVEQARRRAVALGAVEIAFEEAGARLASKRETARRSSAD